MAQTTLTSQYCRHTHKLQKLRNAKRRQLPAWFLVAGAWLGFLAYIGLRHLLG